MKRQDHADLAAFAVIAREGSFTRAASKLSVSASALSQVLRGLEARLGVKLMHRTTRSVALTEAGVRLFDQLGPALHEIESAVESLGEYRGRIGGRVRINLHRTAALHVLAPRLRELKQAFPDIVLDLAIDEGLTDIIKGGFDAGIRPGELVAKDMVAVRVGLDQRSVVVVSPDYLRDRPLPQAPADLRGHACIAYRQVASNRVFRWEFERDGRRVSVAVEPVLLTNDADLLVEAALAGLGFAYVFECHAEAHLKTGRLVSVLAEWCPIFSGDFLYYASNRQVAPALRAVIATLRCCEI